MIYARQCDPRYQESPIFSPNCFPDNIAVFGNRDYWEHIPEVVKRVYEVLEEEDLDDAICDITKHRGGYWCDYYKNVTEVINDLLPSENGKYSNRDIHAIKMYVNRYPESRGFEKENILCSVLGIVTKKVWKHKTISGTMQCEWNEVYYPADEWSDKDLRDFEVMYFDYGSEWCIYNGDDEPETPEDIDGSWLYCCSLTEDGIRREIAEFCEAPESEVVMYRYAGERRQDVYELAS